ncbi:MAG TPA: peptidoglycan-binding domain-containing protein, partial [Alphaproteobacteria bacterium]|nr:peptidoglycan-binding domain-containing protein [Alphaproteobacteria bacterium]
MRTQALLTAATALAAIVALTGCGSGPAPSSAAYTKAPPEGSTAVQPDPKMPIVLGSGTDTRTVEQRLAQLNFTPGRVNVSWDSDSQAAVEDFQRVQGAPVGPLDRATLEAMGLTTVPLTHTGPVAATSGLSGLPAEAESAPGQVRVGAVIDSGRAPMARRPAAAPAT